MSAVYVAMTTETDSVRVWLVERSFAEDWSNIINLVYATTDGTQYFLQERALTGFSNDRVTRAARDVDPDDLGTVDEVAVDHYATEAKRMASVHDPDDPI